MKYVLIFLLALCGCASTGIHMSDNEAKACQAQGCSVWTQAELRELISKVAGHAQAMLADELDTHGCLRGKT